jgi:hypothetical protein
MLEGVNVSCVIDLDLQLATYCQIGQLLFRKCSLVVSKHQSVCQLLDLLCVLLFCVFVANGLGVLLASCSRLHHLWQRDNITSSPQLAINQWPCCCHTCTRLIHMNAKITDWDISQPEEGGMQIWYLQLTPSFHERFMWRAQADRLPPYVISELCVAALQHCSVPVVFTYVAG